MIEGKCLDTFQAMIESLAADVVVAGGFIDAARHRRVSSC